MLPASTDLPLTSAKAFAQQSRITAARTCRIRNNLPLIVNPRMAGKAGLGSHYRRAEEETGQERGSRPMNTASPKAEILIIIGVAPMPLLDAPLPILRQHALGPNWKTSTGP